MKVKYLIKLGFVMIFLSLSFPSNAQKNELTLDISYALFYFHDFQGYVKKIEYDRLINGKFSIGLAYETTNIEHKSFMYYTSNAIGVSTNDIEWPFPHFCNTCDKFNHGFKQLPAKQERLQHDTWDILATIKLFERGKSRIKFGIGPTLTTFSVSAVSLEADGKFESVFTEGNQPLRILVFQFEKFIDFGLSYNLSYDYSIFKSFKLGFKIGAHHFFNNSFYYSTGLLGKISF